MRNKRSVMDHEMVLGLAGLLQQNVRVLILSQIYFFNDN